MNRSLRSLLVSIALLLPTLSLVFFGILWIWQNGYLLIWAISACAVTFMSYLLLIWLTRKKIGRSNNDSKSDQIDPDSILDPTWTDLEKEAWQEVIKISAQVEPEQLNSREKFISLGRRVVESVSRIIHPNVNDPLLKFTVPEALLLSERVSNRLRSFILKNVPLGDQLTVSQLARLYHWRFIFEKIDQGYTMWRALRLLNPWTAITHEMREQMTRKMYEWGRDEVARKIAKTYVKEVGRTAIDLYSGRLNVSAEDLAVHMSEQTKRDQDKISNQIIEPLRLLVLGSVGAGKSSLINALFDEVRAAVDILPTTPSVTPYEMKLDGQQTAIILDSPGLTTDTKLTEELISEATNSDMILWVVRADRADREIDRKAIDELHTAFARLTQRQKPPILVILSHVDRLRPFQEWSPPYNLREGNSEKAATILEAMRTVGSDLDLPVQDIIPVCFNKMLGTYNIDALWAGILDSIPEARSSQLIRCLREAAPSFEWTKLWSQAVNAGRVLARTVINN